MTISTNQADPPEQRSLLAELIARFVVATPEERQRLLMDYPVLLSPVALTWLDELQRSWGTEVPTTVQDAINMLHNGTRGGLAALFPDAPPENRPEYPSKHSRDTIGIATGERVERSPVSNIEYAQFILETGYPPSVIRPVVAFSDDAHSNLQELVATTINKVGVRGFQTGKAQSNPNDPAVEVSWFDALEYARWERKRVPTTRLWDALAQQSHAVIPGRTRGTKQIYEWTTTRSESVDVSEPMVVIKSGLGDQRENAVNDLRNELGFRCYEPVAKYTTAQLAEETRSAEVQRQMRLHLGFDQMDNVEIVGLHKIAVMITSGGLPFGPTCESVKTLAAEKGVDQAKKIVRAGIAYVLSRAEHFPQPGVSPLMLSTLAHLVVSIADTLQDSRTLAEAKFALGQALLFQRDDTGAQSAFQDCMTYFEGIGDKSRIAQCHRGLGLASLVGDLRIGDDPVGSRRALEHFVQALSLFEGAQMRKEVQMTKCCVANAQVRLGEREAAFWTLRNALAETTFFDHPRDEIVGILHAGEIFLASKHYDYALYVHRVAHGLASQLGDLELIGECRLRLFMCYSQFDLSEACSMAGRAIEAGSWLDSSSLLRTVQLIAAICPDPFLAACLSDFLVYLLNESRSLGLNFHLPLRKLAEIAVSRCLLPGILLSESWHKIEKNLPLDLETKDKVLLDCAQSLALLREQPETARVCIEEALRKAEEIGLQDLKAVSQLLHLLILKEISAWDDAEKELRQIRAYLDSHRQTDNLDALLNLESEICYSAGRATACLEAADEAAIGSREQLDELRAAAVNAKQHVVRSRLLSALGSPKAFAEAFASEGFHYRTSDGFGWVESLLREAQALIETSSFEAAAKRIDHARTIIESPHARPHPRLNAELGYSVAILNYAARNLLTAVQQFEEVAHSFRTLALLEEEIRATTKLAAIMTELGHMVAASEVLERLLPIARSRNRPFEFIDILNVAAHIQMRLGEFDRAGSILTEAIGQYWKVRAGIENSPLLRKTWLVRQHHLFDNLIHRVLLVQGKFLEAWGILQQTKSASLQDLVQESHFGFPGSQNPQIQRSWSEIRHLETRLESVSSSGGQEDEEANLRMQLRSVRRQFRILTNQSGVVKTDNPDLTIGLPDIRAELERTGTALVDFCVNDSGAAAFVLLPGAEKVDVVLLDGDRLSQSSLLNHTPDGRADGLLEELFSLVFNLKINGHSLLAVLKGAEVRRLVLIPAGPLSLLPLQAATDGQSKKCLLDEFEAISFAPSVGILHLCLKRQRVGSKRLLAVRDPTNTMHTAGMEIDSITPLFPDSMVLENRSATRERVAHDGRNAGFLHFACHGHFAKDDPLSSGLRLRDGDLTIAEIYNRTDVFHGALVCAAACESAAIDPKYPDEFVGFPSAFLYAGAFAAVGSLWKVDDFSTALLMGKYYSHMLRDNVDPPKALSLAQRWLRDATTADLDLVALYEKQYVDSNRRDEAALTNMRYFRAQPNSKPFRHPFFWAGFVIYGSS